MDHKPGSYTFSEPQMTLLNDCVNAWRGSIFWALMYMQNRLFHAENVDSIYNALQLQYKQYEYIMSHYRKAQEDFTRIPPAQQPDHMGDISAQCMMDLLLYAYDHLKACQLLLCRAEGTRFAHMVDEMVAIEVQGTHEYLQVLSQLGRPAPAIDPKLEHILITGMFNAYFELVLHEMPLEQAKAYLYELHAFYTAGWMKIMGQ